MENQDNTLCYSSTCSETPNQFTPLNNNGSYSSVQQTSDYPYSTIGTVLVDTNTMEYSMNSPLTATIETSLCDYPNKDCNLNNMPIQHFHDESLSGEASVTSSLDIRTPEMPPVSDITMTTVISSEMVAQSHLYANHPSHIQNSMPYNINNNTSYDFNLTAHQWENNQNSNASFQASLQHEPVVDTGIWPQNTTPPANLTQNNGSYINALENDNATGVISMPHDENQSINMQLLSSNNSNYMCPQEQIPMQQELNIDEKDWNYSYTSTACSQMKKSNNRRHTISYYTDNTSDSTERCSKAEKKLKRRSMNDCTAKKIKIESDVPDLPDKFAKSSFGHLSREELIQRVVELEKEKSLSKQLDSIYSEKNISNFSQVPPLDNSDEEETYSCQWSDCNTVTATLDQLIAHIQDIHIGSGKPAYYCEWAGCTRNQKPFLKRHKMQNHMRTHTGERPFVCQVEGCDKRFSRPDSLNTHIKTHSSIRPYACPIPGCGKAYFHSRSLRKHSKSHEPICTSPVEAKDEYYYRYYPYDKPMKKPIQSCGSEARKIQSQYEPNHPPIAPGYYNCAPPEPTFHQQVYTAGPVHVAAPSYNNSNTNRIPDQNPYHFGQQYYIY